jgi:NitT/TauT family transport system substrate-binding protein
MVRARRAARRIGGALAALLLLAGTGRAAETLKLAIGQTDLWDTEIVEIGRRVGIFAKHGLDPQPFYTQGGGETQQAVIAGGADIGVAAGTLGAIGAFAKGAPIRIIGGEATGAAEYWFVPADSPVHTAKDITPDMTFAYSTAGSGTQIEALRFAQANGIHPRLVATGSVAATFTQVMSHQVDVGFSTPPVGLVEQAQGKIRIIALANDLPSVREQTVRVIVANARDLDRRRDSYARFMQAYRETVDWMYSDPKALEMYADITKVPIAVARDVRDRFYPKAMLQTGQISGLDSIMQDAVEYKYVKEVLTKEQVNTLVQMLGAPAP